MRKSSSLIHLASALLVIAAHYSLTAKAAAPVGLQTYAVGSLAGQLSIEQGAANYTLPISMPPGVAGMKPELALTYNSRAGNGLLGVGWSLSGLSQITRCPMTHAQDGIRGRLYFDSRDRFCLDGQRLIAVQGSYGANGTEYRTETDGLSRIVSYGTAGSGPERFKIWTKAGQIFDYGVTADARLDISDSLTVQAGTIRTWASDRIADAVGNTVDFTYHKNTAAGEHHLQTVSYASVTVELTYETREDDRQAQYRGSKTVLDKRLQGVEVKESAQTVTRYALAYDYAEVSGMSRLTTSVSQFDKHGNALAPTTFTWQPERLKFGQLFRWPYNNPESGAVLPCLGE